MDDDITNAMNSLDASAADVGSVPPAQNEPPVADTANMPPIFRPEDVDAMVEPTVAAMPEATPVAPTVGPEPMPEVIAEQPVQQPEPVALEQTYAPMPQLAAEEPLVPDPEPIIPLASAMPANINPAMVPDPLYHENVASAPAPSVAVDGSIITSQPQPPVQPREVKRLQLSPNLKKIIIPSLISVVALALVGVVGYFGYNFYVASSNAGILTKAAKNLANTKNYSTKITVGYDAMSVAGKLESDTAQNLRFSLDGNSFPIKAIYLKAKDTLYLQEFDLFGTSTSTTTSKNLTAFSNINKAIDFISSTYVNLKDLDPKKNYFTAENMKYIKRDADESISGKSYYKYTFIPSKALIDQIVNDIKKKNSSLVFDLTNANFTTSIWIEKGSFRIYKTEGSVDVTVKYDIPYKTASDSGSQNYKLSWKQDMDYSFSEKIKLPIGSKVTSTTDAFKLVDGTFGESAKLKAEDAQKKASTHEVQNALEQYFVDNNVYPTAAQGLAVLVPTYLMDKDVYAGLTYTLNASGGYELSFVLTNQAGTDDYNVKGNPKIYFVTSKQQ